MSTVSLQKHWHPDEDWEERSTDMLKYMLVQGVVEKKLNNLAYVVTTLNGAHLMTKCQTSEAHKRGCAMLGLRLRGDDKKTRLKQKREEEVEQK